MQGIAVFYKEKGQSSYDVIRGLKKRLGNEKIGHGGSLDPLARGVLIIGIGKQGTKNLTQFLKNTEKTYIAEIVLGAVSDTYDAEGKITPVPQSQIENWPSEQEISNCLNQFQGEFLQTPPPFSAVKIAGKPAYKLARAGKRPTLEPKKVKVSEIKLLNYQEQTPAGLPTAEVRLLVKSGFYVRSFADDLGKALKTGAYLKELTRSRVGDFTIEQAIREQDLEADFLELYFKGSGRVQGVFFRDTTRRWAKRLGLTGQAKNLPGGKEIEIIAQGREEALQEFLEKIKKGPMLARVDSFSHYFRRPQETFSNFEIY